MGGPVEHDTVFVYGAGPIVVELSLVGTEVRFDVLPRSVQFLKEGSVSGMGRKPRVRRVWRLAWRSWGVLLLRILVVAPIMCGGTRGLSGICHWA